MSDAPNIIKVDTWNATASSVGTTLGVSVEYKENDKNVFFEFSGKYKSEKGLSIDQLSECEYDTILIYDYELVAWDHLLVLLYSGKAKRGQWNASERKRQPPRRWLHKSRLCLVFREESLESSQDFLPCHHFIFWEVRNFHPSRLP